MVRWISRLRKLSPPDPAHPQPGPLADAVAGPAYRAQLVRQLVDPILQRLEPAGQGSQPLLDALDVGGGREVQGPDRRALGGGGTLAGAERAGERRIEERVLDQRLRQFA